MCPLTRAPFSFWISFTSGQLFILPWSTSNEMDAKECIKLGYCSTTSAHSFWFVIFSAMVFLSFFLCLLIFSKTFFFLIPILYLPLWHLFCLYNTSHLPSYSYSNRGCAAEPGGGPADQRLHCDRGPQCCPYLCYPGDAAPADHLEEKRHRTKLFGPGGYQCECMLLFFFPFLLVL